MYDYDAWRRDLKSVLLGAGVEGTPTVRPGHPATHAMLTQWKAGETVYLER